MKKTSALIIIALFMAGLQLLNAQTNKDTTQFYKIADQVSLGLGLGQDYGGIGGNLLFYPQDNIGIFAGGGYALAGFGYNVGAKVRFFFKNNPRTNLFVTGMYGYNASVKVSGAKEFDKLYYGGTIGVGLDTGKRSYRTGYWSFSLLFPFRISDVQDYIDDLEDNHGVEFQGSLWPVTFSIGYRFAFN